MLNLIEVKGYCYYNYIESIRNKLDYDIDGVVIKVNSFPDQRAMRADRSPR